MENAFKERLILPDAKPPKVKSLHKALKLLELFDRENPERGISEIVRESGMLKSSVYNIVSTFSQCGYLQKNKRTGKYHLGLKILELGNVLQNSDESPRILKPRMDEVVERCNETVYFAIPSGTEAIYLNASHPKGFAFTRSVIGVRVKMHCTGVGKVMLAFLGDDLYSRVVAEEMRPFTQNTITNPSQLADELAAIRSRGYAIDNMEHEYGIRCVAAPVRNSADDVIGALSISGPSLRIMDDKIVFFARQLLDIAEKVKPFLH